MQTLKSLNTLSGSDLTNLRKIHNFTKLDTISKPEKQKGYTVSNIHVVISLANVQPVQQDLQPLSQLLIIKL